MRNTKLILGVTVGILVGGVIGIKASELIESSQVVYKDNKTVDIALDNLFDELNLGKTKIAEAITAKGVETTSEKTLEEMANNIDNIDTLCEPNNNIILVANHYIKSRDSINWIFEDEQFFSEASSYQRTFEQSGNITIYKYGYGCTNPTISGKTLTWINKGETTIDVEAGDILTWDVTANTTTAPSGMLVIINNNI